MRRIPTWLVVIALVLSVGYNIYQKVSFNRLYWFWGSTFADRLINGANRIDRLVAEPSPEKRSAGVYDIQEAPAEIDTLGHNLDLMMTRVWPVPKTYLGWVGYDLRMFTIGVWNRSNVPAAVLLAKSNPVPPLEDLARLSRVYRIFAEQFTTDVLYSQNPVRHKKALQAALAQIHREGLDELLPLQVRDNVINPQ